ncbi:MAG: ABC transporter ATP-binding protein [Deinococcales bacterium]
MSSVKFEAVNRHFGNLSNLKAVVKAVDNVSFEVRDGEFFSFLGPSGSGKTTCLRLIAGFESPDGGEIWLSGQKAAHLPPFERDVHTVFQDYALFPHMSVLDNVAYSLMLRASANENAIRRRSSLSNGTFRRLRQAQTPATFRGAASAGGFGEGFG